MNKELKKKLKNLNDYKVSNNFKSMKNMKNNFDYLTIIKNKYLNLKDENFKILNQKLDLLNDLNELEKVFKLKSLNFDLLQIEIHNLKNELKLIRPKLLMTEELEKKNQSLSKALLTWDDDLRRFRESRKQIDILRGQWKKFESLSITAERENDKIRDQLQTQIELNSKLEIENTYLRERRSRYMFNRLSRPVDRPQRSQSGEESIGISISDSKDKEKEMINEGLGESLSVDDPADAKPQEPRDPLGTWTEEPICQQEESEKEAEPLEPTDKPAPKTCGFFHSTNPDLPSISPAPPSANQSNPTRLKKSANPSDQVVQLQNQLTAYRKLTHQLKLQLIQLSSSSSSS